MELIDQSSDAGFHHCDFEIHQQTNRVSGKLEISYQLSFMNWENSFDGLEFDYDQIFNNHIHNISAIESHALVIQRQRHLPFERQLYFFEFITQTFLIR